MVPNKSGVRLNFNAVPSIFPKRISCASETADDVPLNEFTNSEIICISMVKGTKENINVQTSIGAPCSTA